MPKENLSDIGKEVTENAIKSILGDIEVSKIDNNVIKQVYITTDILNIRSLPSQNGEIAGKLKKNDIVSVFNEKDGWFQVKYNGKFAYISAKFCTDLKGLVTAGVLNIRETAATDGTVLGKLKKNDKVDIIQKIEDWYKIRFENKAAFVASKYISPILEEEEEEEEKKEEETQKFLKDNQDLHLVKLEPAKLLPVATSSREAKTVSETYNSFGGLIERLSQEIKIEPAAAVAVLAVESGGKGFSEIGKVTIRFENHLFHRFWGVNNEKKYFEHFDFSKGQSWKGHVFRKDEKDAWSTFHGDQKKEWEVLDFARTLDSTTAIMSASYGLPQVIGSNFNRIGYKSPEEMLEYFEKNIRFHILALFDFFSPEMIINIRKKNFTEFAADYNGRGQAAKYGAVIKTYYDAFKKMV